jgi:acyl-CoA thioesterase FadM
MFATYAARVALALARDLPKKRSPFFQELRLPMRVWPADIDLYFHMNNGAYLTLMDAGRYQLALRTGLVGVMVRKRTWPLLGGAIVRFRRELGMLDRFELVTRMLGWDGKWFFVEQRFERGGYVHAAAIVEAVMRKGGRSLPFAEIAEALGVHEPSPPLPDLETWKKVFAGRDRREGTA